MSRRQSTNAVVMIRPARFYPNPETAADNSFQRESRGDVAAMTSAAQAEFDRAVATLRAEGVTVHVFDDTALPEKPDAVFPNNWFSTHDDGRIALYPMFSAARRRERRTEIVDALRRDYRVSEIVDYSAFENHDRFLEGTGSLVLDHENRVAYVSLSKRANHEPLENFCADFGYRPVTFESFGDDGQPVYHTNVILCVGTRIALLGAELIRDEAQRNAVRDELTRAGKTIVELTRAQIGNFAGNAIELEGATGKLLLLSQRGFDALTAAQRIVIQRFLKIIPLALPTIELAGGSARCMIATVHLPPR